MTAERIFCAVDTTDLEAAISLAELLKGEVGGLKLGNEFFTAHGPAGLARIAATGHQIFLDLKFHDIPNTVAGAVRAAAALRVSMLTVHASGGPEMLRAATETAAAAGEARPLILAVTVLTSIDADDLSAVDIDANVVGRGHRTKMLFQIDNLENGLAGGHDFFLTIFSTRLQTPPGKNKIMVRSVPPTIICQA